MNGIMNQINMKGFLSNLQSIDVFLIVALGYFTLMFFCLT